MAAERAAELTEAYRILSDDGRRSDYDRTLGSAPAAAPVVPPPAERSEAPAAAAPGASTPHQEPPRPAGQFKEERATVDQFVRKAAVGRFHLALAQIGGSYDESPLRGFDIACVPKAKMFGKGKGPVLLGRFVSRVDADAVAETLALAVKSAPQGSDEVCVFLMGGGMAPPRELATAINEQRRKTRSSRFVLIPIDARNWDAHIPNEAPPIVKDMLARMRHSG